MKTNSSQRDLVFSAIQPQRLPNAGGAHTLEEWVSINDLTRVAKRYALTALEFC